MLLYEQKERFIFRRTNHLRFQPHLHDAVELVCLLRGESTFIYGSERIRLQAGDFFVSFPDQIHGYVDDSPELEIVILILPTKTCLRPYRKTLTEKLPQTPYLKKGSWEHTGLPMLLQQALDDKDCSSEEIMHGYFQVIMGKLLSLLRLKEVTAASDDALRRTLLYIKEHYRNPLSRKEIARAVGYNESYISHLFSDVLQTTLPEYIHSLRLEEACQLLTDTDRNVTDIALELGFGSVRTFHRVFQKNRGMTPSQYRQKILS